MAWLLARTGNPNRHRIKRSKGCLTWNGMCAEKSRRRQRGLNCLAKVIAGMKFKDGIEGTESAQVAA